MEYRIDTETPDGDLILIIDGIVRKLSAWREQVRNMPNIVALDGTLLPDGRIQVNCLRYQWKNGYEKWGQHLGGIYALAEA